MSKNTKNRNTSLRWQLLVSVSASALIASAYAAGEAQAADKDGDRPLLWIELGGQLQSLSDSSETFSPPFMASITQANLLSALNVQKPMTSAIGEDAKLTFQPDDSDWIFSASIQYGRSAANRHHHQQTANKTVPVHFTFKYHNFTKYFYPTDHVKFADGQAHQSETHAVLDFQAGKDVGLGLLGGQGSSVLSVGVRIAQFASKSDVALHVLPDLNYPTAPITSLFSTGPNGLVGWYRNHPRFHDYGGAFDAQRSFRGLGPSLSWNASVPFAGDSSSGELSLDWSVNGAILFGRQKASGHHKTTIHSYYMSQGWQRGFQQGKLIPGYFRNNIFQTCHGEQLASAGIAPNTCHTYAASFNRVRTVAVPNLGGVVGLSYRIQNFKVSLGYRADFFFNAIDGGIDMRKEENRGFFGPYASISVGLGN